MFLIAQEMIYLAKLQKAYLLSTWNASRISQRTVLFTDVAEEDLSFEKLHGMFPKVAQIWLVPVIDDLEDDTEELEKMIRKLEATEIKYLMAVNKQMQKNKPIEEKALRPTHRSKPLLGHKVDSIRHYRDQIKELLPKIDAAQRLHLAGKEKLASAVFIEFDTISAAEAALNGKLHARPAKFESRQMGVLPEEIIWKNLGIGSKNRLMRNILAPIVISALIIFWSIPVAVVGIITNVNYLTTNVPFLAWIDSIPPVILGVVTGLLPTILLVLLMALVPIICRCTSYAHRFLSPS